jgi:transposase
VPEAYAPSDKARELRLALRERMFYVRLRTRVKNRIVTVFDRYPEQTAQLKKLGDLFGKTGRRHLAAIRVSDIDRIQIDRGLDFIGDINGRIKQSELINAEIDDISRFRNPKKLAAYAGLVPSTYSSGGKTYHGKLIKQGNKWLRWAFVEAVAPAVATDPQLRAQYEHLKFRGVNKARVAIARKLLTIAFQILRDRRAYERRGANGEDGASSTISQLS